MAWEIHLAISGRGLGGVSGGLTMRGECVCVWGVDLHMSVGVPRSGHLLHGHLDRKPRYPLAAGSARRYCPFTIDVVP